MEGLSMTVHTFSLGRLCQEANGRNPVKILQRLCNTKKRI